MIKYFKFIELLICLQTLIFSTMIPVFIKFPHQINDYLNIELPLSMQIPSIIIISLIFKKNIVFSAFGIYLFLGLFIMPIFHHGGSLGYLLTPNFGYLIGLIPLIVIINKLTKCKLINSFDFIRSGILGILAMHLTGIFYSLFQIIFHKQINIFLYNVGNYSLGKISYHFLMIIPIVLIIKPINYIRSIR